MQAPPRRAVSTASQLALVPSLPAYVAVAGSHVSPMAVQTVSQLCPGAPRNQQAPPTSCPVHAGADVGVSVGVSVGALVVVGVCVAVFVAVRVGVFVGVGVAQAFATQTSLDAQHTPPTPPHRPTLVPAGPQLKTGPAPCAA